MRIQPRIRRAAVCLTALLLTFGLVPSASALSLGDLVGGGTITSGDGSLTFSNFAVDIPDPVGGGRTNSLTGIDLDIFQINVFQQSFGFQVLELDGPFSAQNGGIGVMALRFDVVATAGVLITSVGLDFVGAAAGSGAFAAVRESIVGPSASADLQVIRQFGGAQTPSDSATLATGQSSLSVQKGIVVDSANGFLAQISEIEQTFGTQGTPIPEPSAALLFAAGALIVGRRARGGRSR